MTTDTKPTPCSIHIPLHEHETADFDIATWPQDVQRVTVRELDGWAKRNPGLDIVDIVYSFDAGRRVCVTEFHYAAMVAA